MASSSRAHLFDFCFDCAFYCALIAMIAYSVSTNSIGWAALFLFVLLCNLQCTNKILLCAVYAVFLCYRMYTAMETLVSQSQRTPFVRGVRENTGLLFECMLDTRFSIWFMFPVCIFWLARGGKTAC